MQRLGHQTRSRSRNYRLLPPPPSAGLGSRQWLPHACASRSHTTKQRTRPGGTEPAPSQTQTQRGHRARQARAGGGSAAGVGSGRVTSGRGLAAGKGPVSPRAVHAGGTSGAARRRQVCARVSRMSGEHRRGQKTLSEERWLRLLRHQTAAPGSSGGTKQNRRRKEHTAARLVQTIGTLRWRRNPGRSQRRTALCLQRNRGGNVPGLSEAVQAGRGRGGVTPWNSAPCGVTRERDGGTDSPNKQGLRESVPAGPPGATPRPSPGSEAGLLEMQNGTASLVGFLQIKHVLAT